MHEPYILIGILSVTLMLFVWGGLRYDVVALFALLSGVLTGIVPYKNAFLGLSNPAVVTVALVMVLTNALSRSGVVDYAVTKLSPTTSYPTLHVAALCIIVAVLSAFMNNIGALALMMPIAIQSAVETKRSPSIILMPLAFCSILGGLTTLIGTPPNILIASYRAEAIGHPFAMFDYAPVGIVIVIFGIIFISLIGWRLLPLRRKSAEEGGDLYQIGDYITEVKVTEGSPAVGKSINKLEKMVKGDFTILGRIRGKTKRLFLPKREILEANDVLIIEASHKDLESLLAVAKLELVANEKVSSETLHSKDIRLIEAVVSVGSRIEGKSSQSMRLSRYDINLLAISRQGSPFKQRLKQVKLRAGDVVLLQGESDTLAETAVNLGFLPLEERNIQVGLKRGAFLPLFIFIGAIAFTAFGVIPVQISFAVAVLLMLLMNIISPRNLYDSIDWSIIVLLAAMIPLGTALQTTGGTDMIAHWFISLAGHTYPAVILGLLLIVCMSLSDLMNNAATAVVMAPIAISIANAMHANVDTFLMTVAVGASSSFLTPIGHQNNTLVLGPGGYKFIDYCRMGLPLQILILLLATPMILWVWPL